MSKAISLWDLPTSSADFASWATRQRRDCSRREKLALAIAGDGSSSWPTPTAQDGGYFPSLTLEAGTIRVSEPTDISDDSGGQYSLRNSARIWTQMWLALRALGWRPISMPASPSSPRVRVSFTHGTDSFVADLISNPRFYEMTMGWPINWTAPEARVTEFAAWLQRSRGALSALPMPETDESDAAAAGGDLSP
jgi:hypothetical protein